MTTELIAGMQSYLTQLILPIMAADLDAQSFYGLIIGSGAIAQFIALPIGANLISRFRLPPLLMVLTLGVTAGAIISAVSPNVWAYLLGQVIRSFAGGAMATATIGAVALGLEGRARRLTLAFSSASWVIASIVGPTYAAWVTHLLSWRWSMLIYLPLLVLARWIIAMNLKTRTKSRPSPLDLRGAVMLGSGLALTIAPVTGVLRIVLVLAGVAVLIAGAVKVLPPGTFTNSSPRYAAIAVMFFLTGTYFAANEVITLTHHDVYAAGAQALGVVVLCGGLAWALIGLLTGVRPAKGFRAYANRATVGTLTMAGSFALIAVSIAIGMPWPAIIVLSVLWTVASVGMGMTYLDTLNTLFEEPHEPDGLTLEQVAAASVIAEAVASSIFVTLATVVIGGLYEGSGQTAAPAPYVIVWVVLAVLALVPGVYLYRARANA
ncbi:MFS transporter [Actinomyces minihominis]|uniref:MFS transporter n=1 Tax=Actinomyces minihominis TaxID=2002838 RepID=UPI001F5D152F|nr:MFS transporter [Actinomyces minihominis]